MGKVIRGLAGLAGLLAARTSWAGGAPGGNSTFDLSWTSGATAVPTLGVYGTIALALLVMVVIMRVMRNRPAVARVMAPVAGLGLTLGAGFWVQDITAGVAFPTIGANACSGSQTYTGSAPDTPPPCFVNTCGAPVTVSYTFISGENFAGAPLTAEGCTLDYFCEGEQGVAAQGALIPSDGRLYATAFCQEVFPP